MKKIMKRIMAIMLTAVMLVGIAPLSGFITKADAAGGYRVGDTLTFGSYPQTTVTNDYLRARLAEQSYDSKGILYYQGEKYIRIGSEYYGMLPITWRVLSVDSDGLYIMAEKILDCQPYYTNSSSITWADCTLRTWLNGYFYNLAFSDSEKQKINTTHLVNGDNPWYGTDGGIDTYDKVFIPSVGDVLNTASGFSSSYSTYDSARFAQVTPYAQAKGAYVNTSSGTYNGNGYWWLRTPGYSSYYACSVNGYGYVNSSGYYVDFDIGVRPALKINLSSSIYQSKSYNSYEIKTVDGTTGKPVSGVSVVYDGNSVGTTKSDGTYTLSIGKNTDSNKEVKFVKGEYSSSSRKLYEMNPYGQNIISMNGGFDISGVLSDIALTGEKIDGPTVNIMGKSFPLFSFDGGLDFGSFSFKYNQNTKDKTVKYIVGIKDGVKIDSDDDFNDNYDEFKSFFKGFSDNTNYKNYWRYNNIKNKLQTQEAKIGFNANLAVAGYLEFDYSTGSLKFKEGGIVVTADAAVSQDVPFWGICYATFKIGGEIEGKLNATQESSGVLQLNTSISVSVKPTIGVGAKLLSKDIASVEAGINGKITGKIKLPAASFKESASFYLNANAYVKVKALWVLEHKWSTNFPNMNIWPNFGEFQTSSAEDGIMIDENGAVASIDEDDLELIDRSYLDVIKTASYSGNDYLNDTAVYPYGYPELIKLDDGRIVALYLYDNGQKSDINRTTLYYSVYNNNAWSLPLPVCDSGLADFPAKVCTDGNKIYMVWQRASEVLNDKYEVSDIVDKTELVYSEFNGSEWSAPVTVDTAGKYQMLYSIAESNGKIAIEWAENSVDSYTLSDGVTSVYYKTLENDTWSSQTTVASNEGIAAATVGFVGNNVKVIYSLDSDGDLTTANDSDIYINGTQFTDNNVDEGEITYQNGKFYWIQGGELCEYDGYSAQNTGLYIENDYRVLSNGSTTAVTSLASDGFKNELVVSYLNGDTYTNPVALTDYGRHIGYYDAILNSNGSISVLADVDNLSNNENAYPYTTTDMVCDIISGKTDLEICDVFAGDGVARGSTVTFSGTVKNNGTTPVSSYSVTLKNSSGNTLVSKPIYSTILPGESKEINVDYTLPDNFTKRDVKVVVEADGDSVTANNTQTTTVGYADIQIVNAVIDRSGEITATVVNNGLEAVSNAKIKYVYSGANADTTLSNITVGSIGIGEVKTVTYSVPAQYLKFADNYSVNKFRLEAMSDSEEEAIANNEYDVIYAPIAVEGITLNTSTLSLEYGQTAQLVATVYPSNAYNKGVHFVSDSTDVANVDENGNITTVGNGTAIITAITDDGDYIAQCQVTVSVKVTSVDLDQKNVTVNVGNTITINANVTPDAASDKTVKWTSSDNTIATVDDNGTVRGVKTGTATITAKTNDGGFEASCNVNVINAVNGITISDRNITLYANKTKQLYATVIPDTAENANVTWESKYPEIATVDSNGKVTAKMAGTTMIVATSVDGGYKAYCSVKVVGVEAVSTASIDFDTGIITGLSSNLDSLDDYIELTDTSCELKYDTLGTDSIVYLTRNNEIIDAYTVVIFGDVNGDGWYDGMDSMVVNCLANGMLTKDDVGEAVYMAADCNHDGAIDSLDVDILREAGVLLANIDQSKSSEELLATSSAYAEYLNLIDQTVEVEDNATDEPIIDAPTDEPVNDKTNVFVWLVDVFVRILNYLKLHFAIIR